MGNWLFADEIMGKQKTHLVKRMFVPAFPEQDYSPEAIALRYAAYQSGTVEVSFLPLLSECSRTQESNPKR